MEKKRIEMEIEEEYNSLLEMIKDKSLDELLSDSDYFDFNENDNSVSFDYKSLSGKIYEKNGKCVLSEKINIWFWDFYFPIGYIQTDEKEPIINFL